MIIHEKEVTPSIDEKRKNEKVAEMMVERCKEAAKIYGKKVDVILGGSYAHDTWLPGKGDIDLFLAFDKELGKSILETEGLKIAYQALSGYEVVKRFAEHPYLEGFVDGVRVNVVPCLKVKQGEWISAADRSPFHTELMTKRLDERMRLHVRLLKKLLQTQRLYGAEIKVRGFSGYVSEVLIAKWGGLEEVIEAASEWKNDTVVSLDDAKTETEGFAILDPVDQRRNLAKAIAPWKVSEFIFLSRVLVKGTSCDPFEKPLLNYLDEDKLSDMIGNVLVITFRHKRKLEDTIWGELGRSSLALVKHLEEEGFEIINYTFSSDLENSAIALLLPGDMHLDLTYKTGPEVFRASETDRFILNNKNISWFFIENFRSLRIEQRKLKDIKDAIAYFMEKPVERVGFSKGIADDASKSWKIMRGKSIVESGDMVVKDAVKRVFGYSPKLDSC
jgi:tRNA nucleotidyltransferase (CCA-adding enzyme)